MRFRNRTITSAAVSAIILLAAAVPALAQGTMSDKIASLRPPAGAKVAVIVFEDLQCPDCARAAPLLEEVTQAEKVPLVRHDFPLPMHNYSRRAAIIARYFDTKSKKIGDAWRDYVFANQLAITPETLDARAATFAKEHGTAMPFMLDPGGKFEAAIQKDFALGQKIGIQHTPTIFVVSNKTSGVPFVEVVDRSKLSQMIEDMKNGK
jgi:protein-disulfide isomerase